ncbi:MAG: hypothetical protein ACUVX8_12665, partial [Candidatus Zipacnadales bacterium]
GLPHRRTPGRGALAAWGGGFATVLLVKYGLHASWTLYTGAELAVTFGVFFLEGYLFRPSTDEQQRIAELFDQLKHGPHSLTEADGVASPLDSTALPQQDSKT